MKIIDFLNESMQVLLAMIPYHDNVSEEPQPN